MKKFDFKLRGLLKLRKFVEDRKKIELGEIVKEIQRLMDENEAISMAIDVAYKTQESDLKNSTDGRAVKFYPYYIAGRNAHIDYNKNRIHALEKQYEIKVEEMKKAMGDVKVIAGLKDKQLAEHRRMINKKQQEESEELFQMKKSRELV